MGWKADLAIALAFVVGAGTSISSARGSKRVAMLCAKTDEEISGDFRTCYYDCAGVRRAITIPKTQWCPLLLER